VRRILLAAILACSLLGAAPACAQEVEHEPVLLVATPDLMDPNFAQTVVLVLFPAGGGPLGVILNRQLPLTLKEAFPDEPQLKERTLAAPKSGVQRYFLGYSGWAPVQLEVEIARGGWYVLPADPDTVLKMDPAVMWRELLARATAVKT
jgi:putative transcriptional regulator